MRFGTDTVGKRNPLGAAEAGGPIVSPRGKPGRQYRKLFLWLGSAAVGLIAFAAAWALQHTLIRNRNCALLYLQAALAYDRGMTQHANRHAQSAAGRQPVVVVEIGRSTYDWSQSTDFAGDPSAPFEPGKPV